jgi:hypothetical protein
VTLQDECGRVLRGLESNAVLARVIGAGIFGFHVRWLDRDLRGAPVRAALRHSVLLCAVSAPTSLRCRLRRTALSRLWRSFKDVSCCDAQDGDIISLSHASTRRMGYSWRRRHGLSLIGNAFHMTAQSRSMMQLCVSACYECDCAHQRRRVRLWPATATFWTASKRVNPATC